MKTLLKFSIGILAVLVTANQCDAQWAILGNTGTNETVNYVGTTDAHDLNLGTGGSFQMRLT